MQARDPKHTDMRQFTNNLEPVVLGRTVVGRNLGGPTLADNLREPTLLVFLRHFG